MLEDRLVDEGGPTEIYDSETSSVSIPFTQAEWKDIEEGLAEIERGERGPTLACAVAQMENENDEKT